MNEKPTPETESAAKAMTAAMKKGCSTFEFGVHVIEIIRLCRRLERERDSLKELRITQRQMEDILTNEPCALNKEPEREEKKSCHLVPEELRVIEERGVSTKLEITQGRWKCTICGEWQNYVTINNHTLIGCGAASHSFGGNSVQCCGECAPKGSELLHLANAEVANGRRPFGSPSC